MPHIISWDEVFSLLWIPTPWNIGFSKKFAHLLSQILLVGIWKFTVDLYFAQIWIAIYIMIKWLVVRLNIITKFNFYEDFVNLFAIPFDFFFCRQYTSLKNCHLFNYCPSIFCISSLYFMICLWILNFLDWCWVFVKEFFLFLIMCFDFPSSVYQKLIV